MKRLLVFVAALGMTLGAAGAPGSAKPLTAQQYVDRMAGKGPLKGAALGVMVRDRGGRVVAKYNADTRMTPASNTKLVTTGCALHTLGADYRFRTGLGYTGSILEDGTLEGDLYLLGGGDPTLGSKDSIALTPGVLFGQWEHILQKAGIRRIGGRIVGDGSAYEGHLEHVSWSYDDLGTYYGAGTDALCFYQNAIDYDVSASEEGTPVCFSQTYPETPWMHMENFSVTGPAGTGNSLYLYTTDLAPYAQLRGSFASDRKPKAEHYANKFGALTCAYYFWKYLQDAGWEVGGDYAFVDRSGQVTGAGFLQEGPAARAAELGCTEGPRLQEIVRETNVRSDNFYAEAFLRALGEKATGNACYDSCRVALNDALKGLKLDPEAIKIVDGSGLSRMNYISAQWMTDFLRAMQKSPAFPAFLASLPTPGEGTLSMIRLPANRIRMKSGSMDGVLCYSGYILDTEGNPVYTFSLLTNNALVPAREVRPVLVGFLEFLLSL